MSGKLLLISDLEGCAEKSAGGVNQSRFMCSDAFFSEVKNHLLVDPANKVAFLGDYFDQGNKVLESINGIMDVYNSAPDRVTIIVGNRDVNKLRLVHEMDLGSSLVGEQQWSAWKLAPGGKPGLYTRIGTDTTLHERITTIVSTSMGAKWPIELDKDLDEFQSAYLLLKVFCPVIADKYARENNAVLNKNSSGLRKNKITKNIDTNEKYTSFVNNCRNLFRVAKIVHYDDSFKTLMSHAGGMDSFFFHTPAYYDSIKSTLKDESYFNNMELARQALMTTPKPDEQINTFDEETYNAPLREVVESIFGLKTDGDLPGTPSPSPCYFLLQALGLKPDGNKHFTSFIQSCDNTGCGGPLADDSKTPNDRYSSSEYMKFQDKLKAAGVNVVASGHVPHCAPVPLVYKRSDNSGLLFVLNDTSNGYRPAHRGTDSAAVTYVVEGGDAAGVAIFPGLSFDSKVENDVFGFMFGEWNLANAPLFRTDLKRVEYESGMALIFPARGKPFPSATVKMKNSAFAEAEPISIMGGRRRRAAKKTRKAKAKKSKRTRKH